MCISTNTQSRLLPVVFGGLFWDTVTDNEAQGQLAKLVDANGVILCLNCYERLRDFHFF